MSNDKNKQTVQNNDSGSTWPYIAGALVILGIIYLALAWASVDAGYVGVLTHWGAVTGTQYSPGLHFKTPVADGVIYIDTRTLLYSTHASAASSDLQQVTTEVGVNFHVDPEYASWIVQNIGYPTQQVAQVVLFPAVQEALKATTANFTAPQLIDQRALVSQKLQDRLSAAMQRYHILIDSVSLTNFSFSQEYTAAIEQKANANQELQKQQIQLQIARVIANQTVAMAQGNATATLLKANATAEAAKKINQALSSNPNYLEYLSIMQWDGKTPVYMGSGAVPFVNLLSGNLSTGG